jgi:hypothetical protein
MFNWLLKKVQTFSVGIQQTEVEGWLKRLRASDPNELGMLLAMATHMRHQLEKEFQIGLLYPHLVVLERPAVSVDLSKLISELQRQKNPVAASGIFPWLFTLRACFNIELRPPTREMWQLLAMGEPYIFDAKNNFRFISGNELDTHEYYLYPDGFQPTRSSS